MGMNIGHLARKSGISISAIRYYESLGLLSGIDRKANGHREFSQDSLDALILVKNLREAGLSLKDVKAFLSIRGDQKAPCSELADLATLNAAKIRDKILLLRQAEERLKAFAAGCSEKCRGVTATTCGQVVALNINQ